MVVKIIANLAPWLAPIPTAWVVGTATIRNLGWPWPVAVISAVVIECLGLAATILAITLWDYNRGKRKTDPRAPSWMAFIMVGVYVAVAVGLTVFLDIWPGLAIYAPAIFPFFSLVGMVNIALLSDHQRRTDAIAAEKKERKEKAMQSKSLKDAKPEKQSRKYVCASCKESFSSVPRLAAHIRWNHKVTTPELPY